MPDDLTRRDFVALAAATGLLGQSLPLPSIPAAGATKPAGTVVLFQGDSITDGLRARADERPNSSPALGTGYPLLIASAVLRAQPARGWQFFNRALSGDKVPDMVDRWDGDTLALKPDVLSVLVGVNDFWHKRMYGYTGTVADFETAFTALLERTRKALPVARFVVLEPFVLRTGAVDGTWFPEFTERQLAAGRVARRVGATFVTLQAVFDDLAAKTGPAYWAADGVHPTPAGHAVIAERWRATVGL